MGLGMGVFVSECGRGSGIRSFLEVVGDIRTEMWTGEGGSTTELVWSNGRKIE